MKKFIHLLTLSLMLFTLIMAVSAQETGSGGPIIEPNFGDDPKTFNPIIVNDGPSQDVIDRVFPDFIAVDSDSIQYEGGAKGGLVESWDIADDGVTYTFNLRDDLTWSDGVSITAADVVWFLDAALSGETTSPRQQLIDSIASYEAIDDYTLEIVFTEQTCTAIDVLSPVTPVPAHIFEEVFGDDFANMEENPYNLNPTVTGGEGFNFSNFRPGEQTTLLANPDFPDAELGSVVPAGWIYKIVTDQVVQMEQFFAGEITFLDSVPQANRDDVLARGAAGEFQVFETPAGYNSLFILEHRRPQQPSGWLGCRW